MGPKGIPLGTISWYHPSNCTAVSKHCTGRLPRPFGPRNDSMIKSFSVNALLRSQIGNAYRSKLLTLKLLLRCHCEAFRPWQSPGTTYRNMQQYGNIVPGDCHVATLLAMTAQSKVLVLTDYYSLHVANFAFCILHFAFPQCPPPRRIFDKHYNS